MRRPVVLFGALVAAAVWAAAAGIYAVRHWPPTGAAIERERDTGVRGCTGRYVEPDAQSRCQLLFETQYVMQRNTALFTRLAIVVGPLAGIGLWAAAGRRKGRLRGNRR